MDLSIYFIKYSYYLLVFFPISNLGHFLINFIQFNYFLISIHFPTNLKYFDYFIIHFNYHYFLSLFISPNNPLTIFVSPILIPELLFIPHQFLFVNPKYLNPDELLISFQYHFFQLSFHLHYYFQFSLHNYLILQYFFQILLLSILDHLMIMNNQISRNPLN